MMQKPQFHREAGKKDRGSDLCFNAEQSVKDSFTMLSFS